MHFRLRQFRDDDLTNAFSSLPAHIEQSDLIREALRMYFFGAPTPIRDSLNIQPSEVRTEKKPPVKSIIDEVIKQHYSSKQEPIPKKEPIQKQEAVEAPAQTASVMIPFPKVESSTTFDADAKLNNLFGSMNED